MFSKSIVRSSLTILCGLSLLAGQAASAATTLRIDDEGVLIRSDKYTLSIDKNHQPIIYPSRTIDLDNVWNEGWEGEAIPERIDPIKITPVSYRRNSQTQRSGISLSRSALKRPCTLSVSSPSAALSGDIQINSKVVKTLQGDRVSLDIAAYLKPGTNTVVVSGRYQPSSGSVKVEFAGGGNRVSQQTGGNDSFSQTLIITVR